jgi:LmbE family N-acetylglucosaminyl deacetylase
MIPTVDTNGASVPKMRLAWIRDSIFPRQARVWFGRRLRAIARIMLKKMLPIWIQLQRIRKIFSNERLDRSIIVCAHPDDEVLWFSSVLCLVDEIMVCYLGMNYNRKCATGRKRTLEQYPLKNLSCLGIDQSEVLKHTDWQNAELAEYGLQMPEGTFYAEQYKQNFYEIKHRLRGKLYGYRNVFTHNPWGEYGHAEHVQVYMAIRDLQREMGFNLWFPNYFSDVSSKFMIESLSRCGPTYVTKKTDRIMSGYLQTLYKNNGCWTWFERWRCVREESFILGKRSDEGAELSGNVFPLNMIKHVKTV